MHHCPLLVFTTPVSCDHILPASYLLTGGFDSLYRRNAGVLMKREPFHRPEYMQVRNSAGPV
jgi:hypothetical protein